MAASILALGAALLWGTSDFVGGVGARRASTLAALLVETPISFAGVAIGALVVGGRPALASLGWGALAGLAAGFGVLAFYRALATGSMSVVAPVSALTGAAVPVLVGLGIGEHPGAAALLGVALCVVAVALVCLEGPVPRQGGLAWVSTPTLLAISAGVGFGLFFVLLRPVSPPSGLWPLVSSKLVSLLVVAGFAATGRAARPAPEATSTARPAPAVKRSPWILLAAGAGCLDAAANILYLRALQHGLLVSVAVLSSLYPAVTVLLARSLLSEHLRRVQQLGLALAIAGVLLTIVG